MKVIGLDQKEYSWNFKNTVREKASDLHIIARKCLQNMFPLVRIYEEVPLPGSKLRNGNVLFADFVIPNERLVVEVHGKQHYEFCKFYHGDIKGFLAGKQRDEAKKHWCKLNNLDLVELPYNAIQNWGRRINSRGQMD